MSQLVLIPKISEKAIDAAEHGLYTFEVPMSSNKLEVAKAVSEKFKVDVTDVNIIIVKGKSKMFRRHKGREKDVKKALVKVKSGQSIALFEVAK